MALFCIDNTIGDEIPRAQDAPQPLTPQQSAAQLQLPAGFHIELVASEPLISDPSGIAFDAHGRLFVCELHGYNMESHIDTQTLNQTGQLDRQVRRIRWELEGGRIAAESNKRQFGKVKLLHDTDGNGQMDRADLWADDLPPCYGMVPYRDGVIVVCAPDIIFLADRDGDGKAEIRETLYTGFHNIYLERGINNPRWGPDHWIYVGAGGFGATIEGPHLNMPVRIGDSDFRIRADGSALEPLSGKVSTFGLVLNKIGDRFLGRGNTPVCYGLPLANHYLRRNPHVTSPSGTYHASDYNTTYRISQPHPWRIKRRQDPAWIKFYGKHETSSAYYTAGCGVEFYYAQLFPDTYYGSFFCCEPSHNLVHRAIIQRDGPGYIAQHAGQEQKSEFLASSDQWFRPINLQVGPDGALYIVDMYREIVEDYSAIPRFLQQQYQVINGNDRGRIWRLLPDNKTPRKVARLTEWSSDKLAATLSDPDSWWSKTAQRLLIERNDPSTTLHLAKQVRHGTTDEGRMLALHALQGIGKLTVQDVSLALNDSSYMVRTHGLQLGDCWLNDHQPLLAQAVAMAHDPDPRVRLQLAMSLGEVDHPRGTEALLELVRQFGTDRWMDAAVLSSARETAGDLLSTFLHEFDRSQLTISMLQPLATTVAAGRNGSKISHIVDALVDLEDDIRVPCLMGLADGLSRNKQPIKTPPDGWLSVKRLLTNSAHPVRPLIVRLAANLDLHDSPELREVYDTSTQRTLNPKLTTAERQRAMKLLEYAPFSRMAPVTKEILNVHQPPSLQLTAVNVLASSNDPRIAPILLDHWKSYSPQLRTAVLDVLLGREHHLPLLLDAVERGTIRVADLPATRRERFTGSRDPLIAARAETLFDQHQENTELLVRIDQYRQALDGPREPTLGRQVFEKHCLNCHKWRDKGHQVGPDLGSAVNKPDEALLLEILDPSGDIAAGFATYTIFTVDGRIFNGILTSESATSVSLRRGKGENEKILRSDIETMTASQLSLMPADLYKITSPQDIANLISFLRQEFSNPP